MDTTDRIEATSDTSCFDHATIGEGALIEPDVMVGFRFHPDCGRARIGKHVNHPITSVFLIAILFFFVMAGWSKVFG